MGVQKDADCQERYWRKRARAATSAGGNGRTKAPRQSGETLDKTHGQTAPDELRPDSETAHGLPEGGAIPNKKAGGGKDRKNLAIPLAGQWV